jgi:glycine betaine/proline transport system substrate-binding protein
MHIAIGSPPNNYYVVMDTLIRRGLEALGHSVTIHAAVHERIYPRLAAGDLDLFVASVLPSAHSAYWPACEPVTVKLGKLFEDGRFSIAVPDYVAQTVVREVGDLARPEIAARFDKTVFTLGAGSGLTIRLVDALQRYGLSATGFAAVPGSEAEWTERLLRAYANGRWFTTILWRPCFMTRRLALRPLDEPFGCMGANDTGWIVAHQRFAARAPSRTLDFLRRVSLGLDGVTEMDYRLSVDKLTPAAAVDAWLQANGSTFGAWLSG